MIDTQLVDSTDGVTCTDRGRRVHSISNFLSLLAVRVARDERQEIVQRHGAALCSAVECAAVISEPGLFDR